jgi:hypothetical protein
MLTGQRKFFRSSFVADVHHALVLIATWLPRRATVQLTNAGVAVVHLGAVRIARTGSAVLELPVAEEALCPAIVVGVTRSVTELSIANLVLTTVRVAQARDALASVHIAD